MNFINFDLRKAIILLLFFALPLISINTQQSPSRETKWYNRPFSYLASIVQTAYYEFSEGVRGTTAMYVNLIGIKKENQRLQNETQNLSAQLLQMKELESENERLRSLLAFKKRSKMELISAQIMSRDLISDHNTIQIDKGKKQGLVNGQAVITTEGVVGHILHPEENTSLVLLITDRYSVVDGLVARSRARGIVEGKTGHTAAYRYVEKSEDVVKGDLIVTSGLDNIFPKGFPIAVVQDVESKPYQVSLKVDLRPVVDPQKIEEVFVIVNSAYEDFSEKVSDEGIAL